jgi:hypothetical protein
VFSSDGGKTWSQNRVIYQSPSGSICECCHPSVAVSGTGEIAVMFRNSLDGNRDMYLVRSSDGGKTFAAVEKLGRGSWTLNGCPMDGGSLVFQNESIASVWRRENAIFAAAPGAEERKLGSGRHPVVVATKRGAVAVWTDGSVLRWLRLVEAQPRTEEGAESFVSVVETNGGKLLLAGEREGRIVVYLLN